ncbi:hypothetical protein [Gallibacterium sp. AGMB14963]|uniref:hypothetical protein n=1 Tax=Gallibacterium faecale TaxID=3019086 RepID=UPI0022F17A50|nr:hypothetical protein [Gallibacterium sp. AGMB14963]MDA3979712.1 hypothetical protein [Gallibacterium sp. AGMB14963]
MGKQIVSKQRVADYGEVYTQEREVNAMLDLVKSQTESLDKTFLEPACGTGNFLLEILRRKLVVAAKNYQSPKKAKGKKVPTQYSYERDLVLAVSSLYGIELLADNVRRCHQRLLDYAVQEYQRLFPDSIKTECIKTIECLLTLNIVHGNALTMEVAAERLKSPIIGSAEEQAYAKKAIMFSHWGFIEYKVKRHQFLYWGLVDGQYSATARNMPNNKVSDPYRSVDQESFCHFLLIGETYEEEFRNVQANLQP